MRSFIVAFLFCLLATQAQAQAPATIKFGVVYFYPPFVYTDNKGSDVYGFDISVAKALCQTINITCTFTPMPLADLFKNLDDNKVDAIMGAISITQGRKIKYEFTLPYFKSSMSYLGPANANFSITPEELTKKTIGVVKGSSFYTYLTQTYGDKVNLKPYVAWEDAIADLSNNKIDLILLDTPVAKYWVKNSSGALKIIGQPLANVTSDEGFGIAFRAGNYNLSNAFNKAIETIIANGTYDKLRQMYLL